LVWQISSVGDSEDDGETYNVESSGPFPSSSDPSCDVENKDDSNHPTGDRYDDEGECILNRDEEINRVTILVCDIEACPEEPAWCFPSTGRASPASATRIESVTVDTAGYDYLQVLKFLTAST
jgi:hypothetical protein